MINLKFKKIKKLDDIDVTFRTTTASESITLPTNGTNNYIVNWGDGSALEVVNTSTPPVHVYAVAGDYDVKINGSLSKWTFTETTNSCIKLISVTKFNAYIVGIVNAAGLFYYCINLVDVQNLNTKNVTNMIAMFYKCPSLTSLDLSYIDTSKVTNMYYMFTYSNSLTTLNLSNWDTSNVTNMDYMFYDCGNNLCITANNNFTTTQLPVRDGMFSNSNILHPTPAEQADLTDANGATYIYTGC